MLLLDAGLQKVQEGLTSMEEVLSTCSEESDEDESKTKEVEADKILEKTIASGSPSKK